MVKFSLEEATNAVRGKLYNAQGTELVEHVTSNSKDSSAGSLFVAVKGEFKDGHDFASESVENGAICVLSHVPLGNELPHILVEDTKYAFMDLAKWYLEKFNIPVVAITGSVGKTTTKDMTAAVLSKKYNVVKNEGNLNNEVGLPLTVFNVDGSTEIAVLEMGMNSFGEIHNLSKIATPEICIIVNIGDAHIGRLGSKEGILKAKSEIFDYADKNAVSILNGDDYLLKNLSHKTASTHFFGMDEAAYVRARKLKDLGLQGTIWRMYTTDSGNFQITIPLPGDYLVYNAMAAVCAGKHFGIDNEEIADAIVNFKPSKNRMDIFTLSGITFINDVYNASPVSMKSTLEALSKTGESGRRICVLGDMLELGDMSEQHHKEVGEYVAHLNINSPVFIGPNAKYYEKGFLEASGNNCRYFESKGDFLKEAPNMFVKGDVVLIKASRGMAFESIIDELKRWF